MPDFTEILKIAVEEQDWKIICGLYTNITGEPLSVPESNPDPIEEEPEKEDILSKDFDMGEILGEKEEVDSKDDVVYNDFTAPTKGSVSPGSGENRRMRSEPVGSKKLGSNFVGISGEDFVDELTEALTDPETGEKLVGSNKNVKITPRNRRKELGMNDTSRIEAVCSICEKTIKVSPVLAHGFSKDRQENSWKCNDCSTRKSKRNRQRDL
tara:strand:- start:18 stop:650 length:633 start_codon:yes stop_codon:yes gene_type:complete